MNKKADIEITKSILLEGLKIFNNMTPLQMCDQIEFVIKSMKVLSENSIHDAIICLQKIKNLLLGIPSNPPTKKEANSLISVCEMHINATIKDKKVINAYKIIFDYIKYFIVQKKIY